MIIYILDKTFEVKNDENKINAMRDFGENLGIAFQIRDDILDYIGTTSIFGKPLGGDIKEKKLTLPIIYALKNANPDESKKILNSIKSGAKKIDINHIIEFVKKYDGIKYAESQANLYARKSIENLNNFDSSEYKIALTSLVNFVIERTK